MSVNTHAVDGKAALKFFQACKNGKVEDLKELLENPALLLIAKDPVASLLEL